MTTSRTTEGGEIQLHFCQRCGISIPVADVASGRAHAAPGGYVCTVCRDDALPAGPAPLPAAAPREGRPLLTLALLFVVGATSFLLYRELTRETPRVEFPATVAPRDLQALEDRLRELNRQTGQAIAALKESADGLRDGLEETRASQAAAQGGFAEAESASIERDRQLLAALDALARRTGITRSDVAEEIARQVEKLRRDLAGSRPTSGGEPSPAPPEPTPPVDPKRAEHERLVREAIKQLQARESSDQQRYTATVRLGELKDPAAVDPLVKALESDGSDLVQRGAAWSLGALGKASVRAIPALIAQVGGTKEWVAYMCDRALGSISEAVLGGKVTFGFDPGMQRKQRQGVQKQWEEWYQKNRETLEGSAGGAESG